jgi:hypothetical protein
MGRALLIFTCALLVAPSVDAQSGVESDALVHLQRYIEGYRTGDPEIMASAFHPKCQIFWMQDGKMMEFTGMKFAGQWPGKPMPDEEKAVRRIASIDVTGTVGTGVIEHVQQDMFVTDYMSLIEVDGEWKIINTIFHVQIRGEETR